MFASLNGVTGTDVDWRPGWPLGRTGTQYSTMFSGLDPELPAEDPLDIVMTVLGGPGPVSYQIPDAANDHTLTVRFHNEDVYSDWDTVRFTLTYADPVTGVPEPASALLAGVGLLLVCWARRSLRSRNGAPKPT